MGTIRYISQPRQTTEISVTDHRALAHGMSWSNIQPIPVLPLILVLDSLLLICFPVEGIFNVAVSHVWAMMTEKKKLATTPAISTLQERTSRIELPRSLPSMLPL